MRRLFKRLAIAILVAIIAMPVLLFSARIGLGWNGAMIDPRSEIHATELDGRIYVAGGIGLFRTLDSCEYYDIAEQTAQPCAPLPRALHHVAMASDGRYVYASGGYVELPFVQDRNAALFRYDPAADRWEELAKLPHPIGQHAMVQYEGELLLVGGQNGSQNLDTLWSFDLKTNEWRERAAMPTPRHSHAIALSDGRLYLTGGRSAELGTEIDRVEMYDIASDSWTRLPDMPQGTAGHVSFVSNRGLHVIGGESLSDLTVYGRHDVLDLDSGAWTQGPPLAHPRHGLALATDPASGTAYALGGGARPGFQTIFSVTGTVQQIGTD